MQKTRSRWRAEIRVEHPGRISPMAAAVVRRVIAPLVRACFRPTLSGVENLPLDRPFLLVANHSAGIGLAEILSFVVLYLEKVGAHRPLAGFVLPTDFHVWPLSAVARSLGVIPSTYRAAETTLAAQVPILVFPGGDHESLRPVWLANQVDFGGRIGFLRIARAAGVPIVPLGIRGSHYTAPLLVRSRVLANALVLPRLVGVKRWAISLLGCIGAALLWYLLPLAWPFRLGAIWLWLGTPLVFLPWIPWTIRMRIGAPLEAEELFASADDEPLDSELRSALTRVERAVQALVGRERDD